MKTILTSFFAKYYLHVLSIAVLFLTIIKTFQQLPLTFYQQDEWLGLGQIMAIGWGSISKENSIIQILFGEGRPLTRVANVLFYEFFGLQSFPLAIYSITFHFFNTILVYFIINKLIKNKFLALSGALYFAVADVAHQSVTWSGASFGEQPASFFIFLSVLVFLFFLEQKSKLFLYLSFKESGIFLIPLYLILPYIYDRKYSVKKLFISFIPILLFLFFFAGFRFIEMITSGMTYQTSVYLNSNSTNTIPVIILRAFLYPLTSFSLSFIPYPIAISLGEWLWKLYYPYITSRPDVVFTTVILDLIAVIISVIFLIFCFFIEKIKELRSSVTFALIFFFLSILPYVTISKTYAYLEPRYYYISLLANCVLISASFSFLINIFQRKWKIAVVIIFIIYGFYLRYNLGLVRNDISIQVDIGNERKAFINDLYSYLPTLKNDTNIFYFTGDKTWLVENNFTPFQNGFGYTLMVLYYPSGKIPKVLLPTHYLFALGEEGVKTIDGKTFGYFNNYTDLKKYLTENNIPLKSVISFYYNRSNKKLYNITDKIQGELAQANERD